VPLAELALTDTATARSVLGLIDSSQDALIQLLINAVSEAMSHEIRRPVHYRAGIVERVPGFGGCRLRVSGRPILSIASIDLLDIDGTVIETYASDSYEIEDSDGLLGMIYRPAGWPDTARQNAGFTLKPMPGTERSSIQVTYTAGWITPFQANALEHGTSLGTRTLPYDLEYGCLESVASLWRRRGHDLARLSESTQDGEQISYEAKEGILLRSTIKLCERYRGYA
jgi:hypothetical protein